MRNSKHIKRTILATTVLVIGGSAAGQTSTAFTYQGQLKQNGVPANGSYNLVFKLFDGDDDQVGPTITRNGVVLTNGLFNQVLDFGSEPFFGGPLWLQITANGIVLSPKQPLTATPLALYALNAPVSSSPWDFSGNHIFNLNGGNVGIGESNPLAALHVESLTTSAGNNTALFEAPAIGPNASAIHYGLTGDWYIRSASGTGKVVIQDSGGNVGIGTSSPAVKLEVVGGEVRLPGGTNPANYGTHFNYSGDGRNYIRGATVIADTGGNVGIGTSTPFGATQLNVVTNGSGYQAVRGDAPNGNGVVGVSAAPGYGATVGVSSGNNGIGVYGEANVGTAAKGILGTSSQGIGVYGSCASAQTNDSAGVLGRNSANNGNGVIGEANVGSQAYGVWGRAAQGNGVYGEGHIGGYFTGPSAAVEAQGHMRVSGNFFCYGGTKSFRIDHPKDPESKYLDHYCSEGPEPLNFYRGTAILDAVGRATINLPHYFEDINKDFTYTLTAVGGAMPELHVASKVRSNRFQIAGGAPGGEVCWQVSGVRNDLYVRTYGAPVELEKPERERGKYTHPELYGKPPEMAIHYRAVMKQTGASDSVQE